MQHRRQAPRGRAGKLETVYLGGIALSLLVALAVVVAADLADTAPHLPDSVATLERLKIDPGLRPLPAPSPP